MNIQTTWALPNRTQKLKGNFPTNNGGGLKHSLRSVGEPIYARLKYTLNSIWHGKRYRIACFKWVACLITYRSGQFFNEQGIALGFLDNRLSKCFGKTFGWHDGLDTPHTISGR